MMRAVIRIGGIFMKNYICVFIFYLVSLSAWAFPTSYEGLQISEIEMWPSSTSQAHSYTVTLETSLTNSDGSVIACSNPSIFSVDTGDYHSATLSVLLAAQMAGKKIDVRISGCPSDRPMADRVSITNN